MKKRINIVLSEEAMAALDGKANKSAYIEELILRSGPIPATLTEGRVSYLLTQQTQEIVEALKNTRLATPSYEDIREVASSLVSAPVPTENRFVGMTTADKLYSQFEESA
jgi:hypothetical protein